MVLAQCRGATVGHLSAHLLRLQLPTYRPARRLALGPCLPVRIAPMFWRVPLAVGLILGLLLAPPVARARLLCRWTGEEMLATACQDRAAPEPGVSADDPCCEQRIQTPLPTAKLGAAVEGCSIAEPVLTELAWFETS